MSEFRQPHARTMTDWDRFCDETNQPRPAQQLAEARAIGDTWLAERIERTIVRLGGEIPPVQFGVERIGVSNDEALSAMEQLQREAAKHGGHVEFDVTPIPQVPQLATDRDAEIWQAFEQWFQGVADQMADWLERCRNPHRRERAVDWLRDHETVVWLTVAVVCAILVGVLLGTMQ